MERVQAQNVVVPQSEPRLSPTGGAVSSLTEPLTLPSVQFRTTSHTCPSCSRLPPTLSAFHALSPPISPSKTLHNTVEHVCVRNGAVASDMQRCKVPRSLNVWSHDWECDHQFYLIEAFFLVCSCFSEERIISSSIDGVCV